MEGYGYVSALALCAALVGNSGANYLLYSEGFTGNVLNNVLNGDLCMYTYILPRNAMRLHNFSYEKLHLALCFHNVSNDLNCQLSCSNNEI